MAAIQLRGDFYRILFAYNGKRFSYPVGQVSENDAKIALAKVNNWLGRIKGHLVEAPPEDRIVEFIQNDGALPQRYQEPKPSLSLARLRDEYLALHDNILDATTIANMRSHWKRLARWIDDSTLLDSVQLATLQKYVMDRVGEGVEGATAKKEIITLRTCWNWAVRMDMLARAFPNKGLRFPKGEEKPPFMTIAEAKRRIKSGESEKLWESVFLTKAEIEQFLGTVKTQAAYPWIYPMFCCAAYTGARRSELLRIRVADVDLEAGTVLIREKKRRRDVKESTRRVPLSPFLKQTLTEWLSTRPEGPVLFCHSGIVPRSRKRSRTTGHQSGPNRKSTSAGRAESVKEREQVPAIPLTNTEASHHFRWTLANTAWEKLSGWHVLRHSFISNCAAAGVDQRLIDDWVGHTTEEMRRRYRHLIPSVEQQAIKLAFE